MADQRTSGILIATLVYAAALIPSNQVLAQSGEGNLAEAFSIRRDEPQTIPDSIELALSGWLSSSRGYDGSELAEEARNGLSVVPRFVAGRDLRPRECNGAPNIPAASPFTLPSDSSLWCSVRSLATSLHPGIEIESVRLSLECSSELGDRPTQAITKCRQLVHGRPVDGANLQFVTEGNELRQIAGNAFDVIPIVAGLSNRQGPSRSIGEAFAFLGAPIAVEAEIVQPGTGTVLTVATAGNRRYWLDAYRGGIVREEPTELEAPSLVGVFPYGNYNVPPTNATAASLSAEVSAGSNTTILDTTGTSAPTTSRRVLAVGTAAQCEDGQAVVNSLPGLPSSNPYVGWLPSHPNFSHAHSYYWTQQMHAMRTHWSQGFAYSQANLPLNVDIKDCMQGNNASYTASESRASLSPGRLNFGATVTVNGSNQGTWRPIGVIAHEYGHYINDRYGWQGSLAVKEGFATSVWDRWKQYSNEFLGHWTVPGMSYLHPEAQQSTHGSLLSYGAYQLFSVDGYYPNSFCDANEGFSVSGNAYGCGSVVHVIYWELLWDTCRLGYGSCAENQDVISTGPYASTARRLANSAFAWAIANMAGNQKVGDFFSQVAFFYQDRRLQNQFDQASLSRVLDLLAHHCLGPNSKCYTADHRLPGSRLPSAESRYMPSRVNEGEAGEQLWDVQPLGGPSKGGAFMWFRNPGAAAAYDFSLAGLGSYRVRAVARVYGCASSASLSISQGTTTAVASLSTGEWRWVSWPTFSFLRSNTDAPEITITHSGPAGCGVDVDWVAMEPL